MSYRGLAVASFVVVGWLAGCPSNTTEDDDSSVTTTNVSSSAAITSSTNAASTSASTVSAGGIGGSEGGQGGLAAGGEGGIAAQGGSSQGGSAQGGSSQGGQGGTSGQGGGMCVATISGDSTCDGCLTNNCCNEAATCQSNPSQCTPLYTCTFNSCTNSQECLFPICDAMAMMLVHESCATCLGTNCCVEFKACENDIDCLDCITGVNPSACNLTTNDDVFEACHMANCALECVYL